MKAKRKARGYPTYALYQVQKAFVNALSKPAWITEKFPLHPEYKYEHAVRRAALNAKCPKRTKILSKPKPQNLCQKRADGWQYRVPRAALKCKPTPWNILSSIPKMQISLFNKKKYAKVLKRRQRKVLNRNYNAARSLFNQGHPSEEEKTHGVMSGVPIHLKCFDEEIHAKKVGVVCSVSQKEKKAFMLRMVRLGQPKPKRKPPPPQRGPKKPMRELQKRLVKLIVPRYGPDQPKADPYAVKESALNYQISERTADLARHKEAPPLPPVYDFRGREILPPRVWDIAARQKVTASERTVELSTPKRVKKKAAIDAKDDPYAVVRRALTATASARIIELAKPITRD